VLNMRDGNLSLDCQCQLNAGEDSVVAIAVLVAVLFSARTSKKLILLVIVCVFRITRKARK